MNHLELLTNIPSQKRFVYSKLSALLKKEHLSEVVIMSAFITMEGLYLILNELKELLSNRVRVVIITGFMNDFNNPRVLEFLLGLNNLELRISKNVGFHPKLYWVKTHSGECSFIIGSSNLTNNALRKNVEANLYSEYQYDEIIPQQIQELYDQVIEQSESLTVEALTEYKHKFASTQAKYIAAPAESPLLEPNSMQIKALASLSQLREQGKTKALIISATGSGKTILSAFEVKASAAKTLLFIVHRENILNAAISSYRKIFPKQNIGKFTGTTRDLNNDFIFASVQSLAKAENLYNFAATQFDYIIIDEVHRAGAPSYQKILAHFKPKFLLGMTATPERSDDFDIYRLFDNNLAYEIRLNEALELNLVCPFHYFGIAELQVAGEYLSDYSDFNRIDYTARVKHIISNLKFYGHGGQDKVRGLIFTARIEEAQELSRLFNLNGYKTIALSGADSEQTRERAIKLLENDYVTGTGQPQNYLDYIFSVDIFNEGIDIPAVNQIILLRPTQSAIIFTQQIGRGLRKCAAKDYCVILDFIGNYQSNFLIAVALSGSNSYDREELRSFVCEANSFIPTSATISFERIIRERIFASINQLQISKKFVNTSYQTLKQKINRIPTLLDFKNYNSIDPKIIFKYNNKSSKILYSNYHELLKANADNQQILTIRQGLYLDYISQELLFAARPDEVYLLLNLINGNTDENLIYANLAKCYQVTVTAEKRSAIRNILTLETSAALSKKYSLRLVAASSDVIKLDEEFKHYLADDYFRMLIIDTLELALSYFKDYKSAVKFNDFVPFNRYSRKEVARLLNVNLSVETAIYGYRIIGNYVPIFISYEKINAQRFNANYANIFINSQDIIWYSRPYQKSIPNEIQRIIDYRQNNLTLMIFLKKSDNEGSEHYYLGNAGIADYAPDNLNGKAVIKFVLRLNSPLPDSYFDYFVN